MRKRRRKLKTSVAVVFIAIIFALAAIIVIKYLSSKNTVAEASSLQQSVSQSTQSSSTATSSTAAVKIDTSAGSLLMLANKDNPIAESWQPELTTVPKSYYYSTSKDNNFDTRAAKSLEEFVGEGRKAGFSDLCILSGYRTYSYQQANFNRHVSQYMSAGKTKEEAEEETAKIVAPAGTSEHETGLAADIISKSWYDKNGSLTADFDQTDAGKWLVQNCAKYGFILRYPKDKVEQTGYSYESWHFRYVGTDAASVINSKGYCLEEYIKNGGQ